MEEEHSFPDELFQFILENVGKKTRFCAENNNRCLNRMAVVSHKWHNLIAPRIGVCKVNLTRQVIFKSSANVAKIAQSWWSNVKITQASSIKELMEACPSITKLDLAHSTNLRSHALFCLMPNGAKLESLDLCFCTQLTDFGIGRMVHRYETVAIARGSASMCVGDQSNVRQSAHAALYKECADSQTKKSSASVCMMRLCNPGR